MSGNPNTLACAHRGDSSRFRENTLGAIQSAIDFGAEIVEIDIRLTLDGKVVVIHDPTLERLWGLNRSISELTLQEIRELGFREERIPTLAEVLPLFERRPTVLMIDMDHVDPARAAFEIATQSVAETIWCGDFEAMREIRSLSGAARIWMPWNQNSPPAKSDLAELSPEAINSHYSHVTREYVAMIHALGYKVSVWTVDDEGTMRWAVRIGIDSITTNRLSLLQSVLEEERSSQRRESSLSPTEINLDRAMDVARDLGQWAIMVVNFADHGEIQVKTNPADIVTQIDLMIEVHVREVIHENFPEHHFVGEEFGGEYLAETPTWYLDPVDGTTNFANSIPWSSFSLALAFNRTPLIAVVIDPWRAELFEARKGMGARVNGARLALAAESEPQNPLHSRTVSTELAAHQPWPGMLELLEGLAKNYCTLRIMGSGTLSLMGVAAGRGIGAVIHEFNPIDHLAAVLIVHEAGGIVLNSDGEPDLFPESGGVMTATPDGASSLYRIWHAAS